MAPHSIAGTANNPRGDSWTSIKNVPARKEPVSRQYLAAILASLVSMCTGAVGGWSSPAGPQLMNGFATDLGGIRRLTAPEVSWITSLIHLGALFGSLPAGQLSFTWGRKKFLLSLAVPLIVGWLMIMYNFDRVWMLYLGRFITGISYGSLNVALPIYNNEVCSDRVRGRIGIFYDLMQCVGIIWVYVFGAFASLYWCTLACLTIPIIFFVTFVWMPESPTYLYKENRKADAVRSIKWLHGEECDVEHELTRIRLALLEGRDDQPDERNTKCASENRSILKMFSSVRSFCSSISKVTVKAILIAFSMFFMQRICGASIVVYYTVDIFQTGHSSISADTATITTGVVQLCGSCLSVLFVDNVGRRPLLLLSFVTMTVSIFIFTSYLQLVSTGYEFLQDTAGWIPAVTLCVFVGFFRIGVSPIPWFMSPELIPTEAQRWAQSIIVCISWGTSFLLSLSYLGLVEQFGQVAVYSFFTLVCAFGIFFTAFVVPETRNKSRVEIQRQLGAKHIELNDDPKRIKSNTPPPTYGAVEP